jgi:large subunit ribosomal protein L24
MMTIRKKDKVVVLQGRDSGKRGEVLDVTDGRVLVAKVNMVKKHARRTATEPGAIREKEAFLPLSKVMLVCPKCDQPTRYKGGALSDGTKSRVCRRCGEMIG